MFNKSGRIQKKLFVNDVIVKYYYKKAWIDLMVTFIRLKHDNANTINQIFATNVLKHQRLRSQMLLGVFKTIKSCNKKDILRIWSFQKVQSNRWKIIAFTSQNFTMKEQQTIK